MKPWYLLALALLLGTVTAAQPATGGEGAAAGDTDRSAQALSVYEEGKRLYDAKDYAGALEKFDQAAALEPGKARWQYNRGLALRKLNRYQEARDALLQSRTLDPEYKRAEIDDKLREMGFSTEDSPGTTRPGSSSDDTAATIIAALMCLLPPVVFVAGIILMIRILRRKARSAAASSGESARPRGTSKAPLRKVDVGPLNQRLERVASALIPVEHALRLQEDDDLRAILNRATMAEQRARDEVEKARSGKKVDPEAINALVSEAEEGSTAAAERARSLFGDRAFLPEGERVGCYFCARPLANASFRMQVPLKRGSDVTPVLACPPCANMAAAGQPPPVKVRMEGGRTVHWSELGEYDPYTHRHKHYPGTRMVPAWDFTPHRSLGEVAAIAAGGALATGLAAYGVSRLLDLDSAQESAAAQAAAEAAARQASERREERDWKDHS